MKTQTAVEWFQSQIINIVNGNCELSEIEIFEKAKAMEKEQIVDAYKADLYPCSDEDAEQYYQSTYGK
jgi:hypothetical protein